MALIFNRKGFVMGICAVSEPIKIKQKTQTDKGEIKEVEVDAVKTWIFKPKDKGKTFTFENEAAVLKRYPVLFKKV